MTFAITHSPNARLLTVVMIDNHRLRLRRRCSLGAGATEFAHPGRFLFSYRITGRGTRFVFTFKHGESRANAVPRRTALLASPSSHTCEYFEDDFTMTTQLLFCPSPREEGTGRWGGGGHPALRISTNHSPDPHFQRHPRRDWTIRDAH